MMTMEQRIAALRPLQYRRNGHYITLSDDVLQAIGGDIQVRRRLSVDDVEHGYRIVGQHESLLRAVMYERHGLSYCGAHPNAGLEDALLYRALQADYRLQQVSSVPFSPLVQGTGLYQLTHPLLPELLANMPRGLIRLGPGCTRAAVIADLYLAFPNARILVLGHDAELQHLQTALITEQQRHGRWAHWNMALASTLNPESYGPDDSYPRMLLCTPTAAAGFDTEKCDIAVVLDALQCTHNDMQAALAQVDARFRLFGILDASHQLKPYMRARVSTVFGFDIVDVDAEGGIRRTVNYAVVRIGGKAPVNAVTEQPAVPGRRPAAIVNSSNAYVRHHARNDQICRLARRLADGGELQNSKYKDVRRWLRQQHNQQPLSVTIVVSQLDHAVELGRRLTDWPIITRQKLNLTGLPSSMRRRINNEPYRLVHDRQIVVGDATSRYSGRHSDVIIWAGGGTSAAGIPDDWLYTQIASGPPMLIVDFLDDFNRAAKDWSIRRMRHYEGRDIYRVGTDPVLGRVQRFLAELGARQ